MQKLSDFIKSARSSSYIDIDMWRGRIVMWVAAAAVGLVVVMFAKATELVTNQFFLMQTGHKWLPLVITPLGGVLIVWITRKWFKGATGSGIPQVIAVLDSNNQQRVSEFVSLKIAFAKITLGLSAIAVGFSAGREGPSVQIGASVMHAFRRFLPIEFNIEHKYLILAGGAAGIAAAFNTPLAGIVFAIEELGRRFEQKTNGVLITSIVLSGLVSISLQGNYTYFGHLAVGMVNTSIILPVIVSGLICGLFGGLFSKTLIEASELTTGAIATFRLTAPLKWAAFCGLMVALLGLISHGTAHGSGYIFTRELLHGTVTETWYYPFIKYLATIFTYLSGVPGGIFAPALSIGAGIGNDLYPYLGQFQIATAISALCMTGFLAAVTQAPITSFIIVMEMIDGHEMVISLMAVALIATLVSRILSRPLYSTLSGKYVDQKLVPVKEI